MKKTIGIIPVFIFLQVISSGQDKNKAAEGNNQFAFEIYQKINTENKNIFLSPYSISTALAMTYSGAGSETAKEMAAIMHYDTDYKNNDAACKSLINGINELNNADLKMSVANRLFGEMKYKFNEDYINDVKENYGAPLERMDFKTKPEESRKKINTWVEKQTNDKIKNLIPKGMLPDDTRLVLVNAIYFYGDWANQFDSANTAKKDFYLNKTEKITHKMMWQKKHFEYFENNQVRGLRMPYKGNTVYMEIFLPGEKDGIAALEKMLDYETYNKWQKEFRFHEVNVTFPKFKMTTDFSLGKILKQMGIKIAFTNDADFYRMVEKGENGLKISEVIHKAFIDVGEKGTEAAAATAVIMVQTTSVGPGDFNPPKIFNADHPFIFMIKDRATGSILFMGKVANPEN